MSTDTQKMDAILAAIPWRCFHCDFVTTDPAEAQAHFGDRDDAEEFKPVCKWWDRLSEDERLANHQQLLKELEAERRDNTRLRTAVEGLEYQVESIVSQIKSYKPFRECSTIYQVFCVYDSMEGRALAAESREKELEKALKPGTDDFDRCSICNAPVMCEHLSNAIISAWKKKRNQNKMLMRIFAYFLRRADRECCQSMVDVVTISGHVQRRCLRPALKQFETPICRECALDHELIPQETKRAILRHSRQL